MCRVVSNPAPSSWTFSNRIILATPPSSFAMVNCKQTLKANNLSHPNKMHLAMLRANRKLLCILLTTALTVWKKLYSASHKKNEWTEVNWKMIWLQIPGLYLEEISNQAVISHLENGSLWVLVDGNNSLDSKEKKMMSWVSVLIKNNFINI